MLYSLHLNLADLSPGGIQPVRTSLHVLYTKQGYSLTMRSASVSQYPIRRFADSSKKLSGNKCTQEPPDVEEYPQPLISNFEEKLDLKSMLQHDEEKDIQDGDYNSDYSEYDYQEANGRSVISSDEYFNFPHSNFANYPQDPEYDLESILNGDADQARLEERVSSSYDVNNYEDYQYFADEEA
ncbi:unnamed protein product [Clavelina lepadiformis]|uniref:Uncharacterized protein n=1 Tax=Clavelina lepadiformis TaxID=159417 RepID=A0ABP0FHH2_CLALP